MARVGLGERQIIRSLTSRFGRSGRKFPLGFDDDVATFPVSQRKWLVLKTDTLVGSTDIPPGMSLGQASRKAVVATVSDFAAKGVQPEGLLISLSLRPPVRSSMVNEIARGLDSAAREYGCYIIGGDTGESRDFVIDCIGFGFAKTGRVIRRDGAREGDVIAVTGAFGRTSAGLRILISKQKRLARSFPSLVRSITHPVARLGIGLKLARSRVVNSSIDSSDGLAWSLHEIACLSKVGMILDRVPVAPDVESFAEEYHLDPEELALYGGEEYELVLTIRRESFAALKRVIPSLIRIGTVEAGRGELRARTNRGVRRIEPRGWEHMVSTDSSFE